MRDTAWRRRFWFSVHGRYPDARRIPFRCRRGVHEVADRLEATHGCLLCCAGGRTRQLGDFSELGFALDQREQAAFVSGADDGVALPVSQAGFARDNGRTLRNVGSIRDEAASSVPAGTFVITFPASPKTAP